MKPALRLALAASLLLITLALVRKPGSPEMTKTEVPESATAATTLETPPSATTPDYAPEAPEPPASRTTLGIKNDTYLVQVRANHHRTPQVLLEFSRVLADRMTQGRKSAGDARLVFQELSLCAIRAPSEQPIAASASCAVNAAELADLFPRELAADYAAIHSKLPVEVAEATSAIRD